MSEQENGPDTYSVAPPTTPPEIRLTRTLTIGLMLAWSWWWWNDSPDGAYWIVAATAVFLVGETAGWVLRPLNPIWISVEKILHIVLFPVYFAARLIGSMIPRKYLGHRKQNHALTLVELNEALDLADELEAERKRRQNPSPPPRGPEE